MTVPFLQYLAGGLPHFMELRNGGPDGPERTRGEQRGGGSEQAGSPGMEEKEPSSRHTALQSESGNSPFISNPG
jgi:hypothetical protein